MRGEPHRFLRPTRLPIPPPRLVKWLIIPSRQQLQKTITLPVLTDAILPHSPEKTCIYFSNSASWFDMEELQNFAVALFSATSIWSVVARAVLWLIVAGVIIFSTDTPKPDMVNKKLRTNLGFVLLFLILSGGLMFMLFSYTPGVRAAQ